MDRILACPRCYYTFEEGLAYMRIPNQHMVSCPHCKKIFRIPCAWCGGTEDVDHIDDLMRPVCWECTQKYRDY